MSNTYSIDCQEYSIYINDMAKLPALIDSGGYSNVFILVDDNTKKHCLPKVKSLLSSDDHQIIEIKSGELQKNIKTCESIWDQMIEQNADRKSLMVNLGGGVIGDMGGFAASCYMRGIDFVQIPTTLLSQVDASVGGKLGVDFRKYKNIIGAFNTPQAVIIETDFLKTLPHKELRSGFAEVIKHALIQDKKLWIDIQDADPAKIKSWPQIIQRNVLIKKSIVEDDPYEGGLRKILNFGHTIGHAIETMLLNTDNDLLHGEAIAVGMICESFLSYTKGMISDKILGEVSEYILKVYSDVIPTKISSASGVEANMKKDKKNRDGKIMFSLIDDIGSCSYDIQVTNHEIKDAFLYYNELR